MENITNNTLRDLAATFDQMLASAVESVAVIFATVEKLDEIEALEPDWKCAEKTFAFHERGAQRRLINSMHCRVGGLFGELGRYRESMGRSLQSFNDDIEQAARNLDHARERAAKEKVIETAKTIDRVLSGFKSISTFTKDYGAGRKKTHTAHVLYMIDGVLFQAHADFNKKLGCFEEEEDLIGLTVTNQMVGARHPLFRGGMTPEEIVKAADIRDNIVAHLRNEIAA